MCFCPPAWPSWPPTLQLHDHHLQLHLQWRLLTWNQEQTNHLQSSTIRMRCRWPTRWKLRLTIHHPTQNEKVSGNWSGFGWPLSRLSEHMPISEGRTSAISRVRPRCCPSMGALHPPKLLGRKLHWEGPTASLSVPTVLQSPWSEWTKPLCPTAHIAGCKVKCTKQKT